MSTRSDELARVRRWAGEILAHPHRYAILDTETTGIDETSEIIQIAAIDSTGRTLLNHLVKPSVKRMPHRAFQAHGIKITDLTSAPTWSEIAPELQQVLHGRTIVAYNAEYDRRLARQTHSIRGGIDIAGPWECAMLAYAMFVGEVSTRRPWQHKWQTLPGGDHTALGDCHATLALIRRMASEPPSHQRGCLVLLGATGAVGVLIIFMTMYALFSTATPVAELPPPPVVRDAGTLPVDAGHDAGPSVRRRRLRRDR